MKHCQDCEFAYPCEFQDLSLCAYHSGFADDDNNKPAFLYTKNRNLACNNFKESEKDN